MDWIRDALAPFCAGLVGATLLGAAPQEVRDRGSIEVAPIRTPRAGEAPHGEAERPGVAGPPAPSIDWQAALDRLEVSVRRLETVERRALVPEAPDFDARLAALERRIAVAQGGLVSSTPMQRARGWHGALEGPEWFLAEQWLGQPIPIETSHWEREELHRNILRRHLGWSVERVVATYGPTKPGYSFGLSELCYSLAPEDPDEDYLLSVQFQAGRLIGVELWF